MVYGREIFRRKFDAKFFRWLGNCVAVEVDVEEIADFFFV